MRGKGEENGVVVKLINSLIFFFFLGEEWGQRGMKREYKEEEGGMGGMVGREGVEEMGGM